MAEEINMRMIPLGYHPEIVKVEPFIEMDWET